MDRRARRPASALAPSAARTSYAIPVSAALTQLSRIYGQPFDEEEAARVAVAAAPAVLAGALFGEAADSDDVTSPESALDYLEARLAFLAGLVDNESMEAVRELFRQRLHAWS